MFPYCIYDRVCIPSYGSISDGCYLLRDCLISPWLYGYDWFTIRAGNIYLCLHPVVIVVVHPGQDDDGIYRTNLFVDECAQKRIRRMAPGEYERPVLGCGIVSVGKVRRGIEQTREAVIVITISLSVADE